MTLCLKYHCAFFHHRPQIKSVLKHGVTFEDHKHSRLKEKKKSCTLPQPDLDSPTAFWLWLWCHLSVQVIIALSAACVLARSLPDWLWKHLWIEKKKKSPETCISHRNTSSSGIHYRPYGNMFSAVYNPAFCLPVCGSTCSPLPLYPSQVTAEQLNPWCQDYFIAKVAAIDKYVWE